MIPLRKIKETVLRESLTKEDIAKFENSKYFNSYLKGNWIRGLGEYLSFRKDDREIRKIAVIEFIMLYKEQLNIFYY